MLESLPHNVCTELEIIRRQESVGSVLQCLPMLLEALTKEKNTKEYIFEYEKQLELENQKEEKTKIQAITWIKARLQEIKNCSLAQQPLVSSKIADLEDILFYRKIKFNQNYVSVIWDHLREVTKCIVEFGPNKVFENWVEITSLIECQSIDNESFVKENKIKEISPESKQGHILINILKQGFIKATLVPVKWRLGSKKPTIQVQYGYIKKFIVPDCIDRCYRCFQDEMIYLEDVSTNPLILFKRLRFLSQYHNFQPIELPLKQDLKTWQEVDLLHAQASNGFYFNRFENNARKPPLSLETILKMIEAFLLMVSRPRKPYRKKHANKNEAKRFVKECFQKVIETANKSLTNWQNGLPTGEAFYHIVIDKAQRSGEKCIDQITTKLVQSVCRDVLRNMGVKRNGGRPKHKKNNSL